MISPKDAFLFLLGRQRDTITFNGEPVRAYSQRGEDLIVDGIFQGKKTGFYVDIGANHPTFLSNTKRFYDRGWHGINIEPNPELYQLLRAERPRDVNLNIGIGSRSGTFEFNILSTHTNSSFITKDAIRNCLAYDDKIVKKIPIVMRTLSDVLAGVGEIDFMSIDTEGNEMDVLKSNDWAKHSPKVLIVEIENNYAIPGYLNGLGYELVYSNLCNGIFVRT